MKLVNVSGPQDVVALLLRRKWWLLIPFVGLSAAVILITVLLPEMFVSQSRIVITPRDVPINFVKDPIPGTTGERLSIFTEQLLSDSNLQALLKQYEDEIPEYAGLKMDQKIAKLRKQINVEFRAEDPLQKGQLPITAFRISYQNRDSLVAQKIVKKLVDVFMRKDMESRQAAVNETTDFLRGHVDDVQRQLAQSDDKIRALYTRKPNELADQRDLNLRNLESLRNENEMLRQRRTQLSRDRQELAEKIWETPQQIREAVPARTPVIEDSLVRRYRKVQEDLLDHQLLGHTKEYPDVKKAEKSRADLAKLMTPEQIELAKQDPVQAAAVTEEGQMQMNARYLTLRDRDESLQGEIEEISKKIAQNEKEMEDYDSYLKKTPQGQMELNELQRENRALDRQLQDAISKLNDASLSESAESQQKGSRFKLVDDASLPLTPTKPSKSSILSAGLLLSLLISTALAFLVDVAYQTTWNSSEITQLAGVKVLIEVPRIATRDGAVKALKRKARVLTSLSIAGIAYASFLYVAYVHSGFILKKLDPLIQRLY